jgi:hypothetical protein
MKVTKNNIENAINEMLNEMSVEERVESIIALNYMTTINENANLTIVRVDHFNLSHKYFKKLFNKNKINITEYSNLMAQELRNLKD